MLYMQQLCWFLGDGCALELLAGRAIVDVVLQYFLSEFARQVCWPKSMLGLCWVRCLISLTGWDRCNLIVIVHVFDKLSRM